MAYLIFWLAVIIFFYTYFGYAIIIFLWSKIRPVPVKKTDLEVPVSIILVAHNEENHIEQRVKNLLSLDYDNKLLQILVVSDGSDDR